MKNSILSTIAVLLIILGMAMFFLGAMLDGGLIFLQGALIPVTIAVILVFLLTERPIMQIKKIPTLSVDQIIGDCPHALDCFNNGDFSVSFGDAMHTLVDQTMFLGMLDDAGLGWEAAYGDGINAEQTPLDFEMKKIYERLDGLGDSILIDLGS